MSIGARIKQARKARNNMSRSALSARSRVKYPTLAGIENDDQQSSTFLPDIAAALAVNLDWLRTGKGPRDKAAAAPDDPFTEVVAFSAAVGLSDGVEAQEYTATHGLKFRSDSLRRKGLLGADLAVLYGKGDSMEPVIETGDAVLFNR
ncbi:MAG: helix-turn-helix transcriptional regulator, partial [Proteobacteria bacterium]|nr:helix-turn-helix transcriptional regulator [Pseudomonadota bacterium]